MYMFKMLMLFHKATMIIVTFSKHDFADQSATGGSASIEWGKGNLATFSQIMGIQSEIRLN